MYKIVTRFLLLTLTFISVGFARDINMDSIIKTSVGANKHLFLFLHRTDCGYCESMIMFTLDDDPVRELIERKFIYLHVNISESDHIKYKDFSGNGRDFATYLGYNIYPSSLFFNKKGQIVHASPGYLDKDKFLVVLKYVDSQSYKTMGLQTYQKKKTQVKQ